MHIDPCACLNNSVLEGGTAEFRCERKENKTGKLKNDTIEDIGAKETGMSDLLTFKSLYCVLIY